MAFDASLGPETSQEAVFETVRPLVNDFLRGVNSTVFVYGMTGAGKTFTMLGPNGRVSLEPFDLSYQSLDHARTVDPLDGIVPRAIRDVFAHVEDCALDDEVSTTLSVTFMEIYNERIYDLLGSEQESRATGLGLSIHQDKARGVFVQDLSEVTVDSETEVFCLLARGLESRSVAGTVANDYSSRSHTIFQMTLETRRGGKVVQSKLNLVDLAGSEKWKTYGASGVAKRQNLNQKQIAELTSINQSLSTLGNCIAAVQSGRTHVPFRESSLTRLLHDSIGGNTRTMFIINLSPSHLSLEDTLSALKFAQRAKQVTVRPEVNHATDKHTVVQAQEQEIARLRKLLEEERSREPQLLHDAEQREAAAEDLLAAREALVAVNARLVREQAERARVTSIFEKSMAVLTHHIDLATKDPNSDMRVLLSEIEMLRANNKGLADRLAAAEAVQGDAERLARHERFLCSIKVRTNGTREDMDAADKIRLLEQALANARNELHAARTRHADEMLALQTRAAAGCEAGKRPRDCKSTTTSLEDTEDPMAETLDLPGCGTPPRRQGLERTAEPAPVTPPSMATATMAMVAAATPGVSKDVSKTPFTGRRTRWAEHIQARLLAEEAEQQKRDEDEQRGAAVEAAANLTVRGASNELTSALRRLAAGKENKPVAKENRPAERRAPASKQSLATPRARAEARTRARAAASTARTPAAKRKGTTLALPERSLFSNPLLLSAKKRRR